MKLVNIQTGATIDRVKTYEYEKDGFRKGEYSIYEVIYVNAERRSISYLFGVSKKYEASAIVDFLQRREK